MPKIELPTLFHYDAACRALAEATRVDEVKNIVDVAKAMRLYAKQAKNREAEANAVEIRMRATRRIDQMRQAQKATVGLASGREGKRKALGLSPNPSDRATLAEAGIDKNLAHQARVLGAMDDTDFERKVAEARDSAARVFRRAVNEAEIEQARQRHSKSTERGCTVENLVKLAASGYRAGCIYADPPWRFDGWSGPTRPARSPDAFYPTESVDEIMKLPVAPLAANDCALVLWCTGPHVAAGSHVRIIEAWGFRPSTMVFVWVKINADGSLSISEGHSSRSNAEVCMLGLKGSPLRLARDVPQVVMAPVGEHSAKPEEVRARIERLYPGPYLELYARREFAGWAAWGNEIAAPLKAPPAEAAE